MEEEYMLTLENVAIWLGGDDPMDQFKPLSAQTANRIREIVIRVLEGETLESAVNNTGG